MRIVHAVVTSAAIAVLLYSGTAFSQNVNLSGRVRDSLGAPLADAMVKLVQYPTLSALTLANGSFTITGTIPNGIRNGTGNSSGNFFAPFFRGSQLSFSIGGVSSQQVRIDLYNVKGMRVATVLDQRLPAGDYRFRPLELAGRNISATMYLVRVQIGREATTFKVPRLSTIRRAGALVTYSTSAAASSGLRKTVCAAVDTLEITLCGYVINRMPIDSFTQSGIAVAMRSARLTAAGERTVDSLFDALRDRLVSLDSINSSDEFKAKDFTSLRNGFYTILTTENSYDTKANVGYIVSAVLALNTNQSIWRLVDSLDAYFKALDSSGIFGTTKKAAAGMPGKPGLLRKTMAAEGVTGLGKSLAALSLPALTKLVAVPEFPRFVTIAYVQSIAQNDVLPVLDSIILACSRIEDSLSCGVLSLPIENDTFELDKVEIYVLDAGIRLLRACLNGFCAYDLDVYSRGANDYSWIDTLQNLDSIGQARSSTVYSMSGDTLYRNSYTDDTTMGCFIFRSIKYNMQRTAFLTLRRNALSLVKSDLLAVPSKIKTGITLQRGDTEDQPDDIIRISDITHADNDLADVPSRMINDGVSAALANKFRTPETIADFVTEVLSGPYDLDETTPDSIRINIRVNLTAMLDNPVSDLRTLLPSHAWRPDSEWTRSEADTWVSMNPGNDMFCCDMDDSIAINPALIDHITMYPGSKCCYLTTTFNYQVERDSEVTMDIPLNLLDSVGGVIPFDIIDSLIDAKVFLPYFSDYTVGGLFPLMDRQKWIDIIYQ